MSSHIKESDEIPGLYVYDPRYGGREIPEAIRANCVINVEEFIDWATRPENNVNGDVFFDFKESRQETKFGRKVYCTKNKWRYENGGRKAHATKYWTERMNRLKELSEKFDLPT